MRYSYHMDAQVDSLSSEVLYSESQLIRYRSQGKEVSCRNLKITVSLVHRSNVEIDKDVTIKIIDEEDPKMYLLIMNNQDFQTLKQQQGLLIEYHKFPEKLIELLKNCTLDTKNFHLIMEESESNVPFSTKISMLKIVETNLFREIVHLSLAMSVASDEELIKYISDQMKMMKDKLLQTETRANQSEMRAADLVQKLEKIDSEFEQFQEQCRQESKKLHEKTFEELHTEREKFIKSQEELLRAFETEKRELQRNTEETVNNLQMENRSLTEQLRQTETKYHEQNMKLCGLKNETDLLRSNVAHLRAQNEKLDSDFHSIEKNMLALKTRQAVLEQQIKDKDLLLLRERELIDAVNDEKARLEFNLKENEKILQRREASLSTLSDELIKANEIIRKLNEEYSVSSTKVKTRTNIALGLNKVIKEKEEEIASLHSQIESLTEELNKLKEEKTKLCQENDELSKNLAEKEKALETKNNVIKWLNQNNSHIKQSTKEEENTPKSSQPQTNPQPVPRFHLQRHVPVLESVLERMASTSVTSLGSKSQASIPHSTPFLTQKNISSIPTRVYRHSPDGSTGSCRTPKLKGMEKHEATHETVRKPLLEPELQATGSFTRTEIGPSEQTALEETEPHYTAGNLESDRGLKSYRPKKVFQASSYFPLPPR